MPSMSRHGTSSGSFALLGDRGGEAANDDTESLFEHFIPRFEELQEDSTKFTRDRPTLLEKANNGFHGQDGVPAFPASVQDGWSTVSPKKTARSVSIVGRAASKASEMSPQRVQSSGLVCSNGSGSSHSRRPPSPTFSVVSNGPSALSTVLTKVSLGTAAKEWTEGTIPKPFKRDETIEGERASRYTSDIGNLTNGNGNGSGRAAPPHMRRNQPVRIARQNGLPLRPYMNGGSGANGLPPRPEGQYGGRNLPPHQMFNNGQPGFPRPMQPPERHFEIRLSGLPSGTKKDELYNVLAESALHRAPFSTRTRKLNFWLHVPRAPEIPGSWGQENSGHAFLSLPTLEHAKMFMDKYGPSGRNPFPLKLSGARQALTVEAGNRTPPAGVLEWLNRVPYPERSDQSQRAINDRKADNLVLERIEFGVFCRDGVFSVEYPKKMRNDAKFTFDASRKNFRLSLRVNATETSPPCTRMVVIRSSAIRLVLSGKFEDEHSSLLIMSHPPAYEELQSKVITFDDLDQEASQNGPGKRREYTGRRRSPAFDIEHQDVAPYTSRAIRFIFDTEQQSMDFEDLLTAIGCAAPKFVEMEHDLRRLYSRSAKKPLESWLKHLSSRSVAFQLARLYQNNLLTPKEVISLKPIVDSLMEAKGPHVTADVLHQFVEEIIKLEDRWLDRIAKDTSLDRELAQNIDIVEVLQQFAEKGLHRIDWRENYSSPIMQCLHVVLTPTSMILEGPYPDQSNRPLRQYGHHDHFIRVAFMDEDKQSYFWAQDIDWMEFLEERVGSILRGGIRVAGRKYHFLGYSMSSLRNRSTWFCTPFEYKGQTIDADHIRVHLGDFSQVKRQPARYGARMAQAFTATDPSIELRQDQIVHIKDVNKMYRGEEVCFTDGVGKISLELTQKVWKKLHNGMEPVGIVPSAFQFRLGGFKGVLTVDSELKREMICVRPSQQKFDAPDSNGLEIAYTYTRHMYMFLNRPLIKVLEDLQVPHAVFMDLLKDAVIKAEQLKQYIRETRRQLTLHGLGGPFSVTDLVQNIGALYSTNKIEPFKEGSFLSRFIAESLEFAEVHILRMLKLKARIPVPDAHVGVAVADESGVLNEGEIYTLRHNPGENAHIVQGRVLLVRAPTVDVGDVQFATAVGTPPPGAERFKHLPNVVIFSTKGDKPLLNSLARGDMDGDLVGVISDRRLFPRETEEAMQHKPKTPIDLETDCTIDDVIDFVVRFFRNDILGQIASRHLLIADQSPSGHSAGCGTRHPSCKKLAELQTIAVDAPKSGQSIDLREMPRPLFPHKPDFMRHEQFMSKAEPDEEALIYHSQKILGKLYRAIRLSSREEDNQVLKEAPPLESLYIPRGEDDYVLTALIDEIEHCGLKVTSDETDVSDREMAWYAMHTYAADLRHVAFANTLNAGHPLSEYELFIGTILHGALPTKTKQELTTRVNLQCKELIDGLLSRLEGHDGRDKPQLWANRVLAALRVAVSQAGNFGAQTFGCVAIRSALYLLALMKDVRRDNVVVSAYEGMTEARFEPVVAAGHMTSGPSLLDDDFYGENTLAAAETAQNTFIVHGDVEGEEMHWGNDVSISQS